jgi:hypothetical protein
MLWPCLCSTRARKLDERHRHFEEREATVRESWIAALALPLATTERERRVGVGGLQGQVERRHPRARGGLLEVGEPRPAAAGEAVLQVRGLRGIGGVGEVPARRVAVVGGDDEAPPRCERVDQVQKASLESCSAASFASAARPCPGERSSWTRSSSQSCQSSQSCVALICAAQSSHGRLVESVVAPVRRPLPAPRLFWSEHLLAKPSAGRTASCRREARRPSRGLGGPRSRAPWRP